MRKIIGSISLVVAFISSGITQVPIEGLIAYYKLDGNANNSVSNVHNGTLSNISFVQDRFGATDKAALFNGNASIEIPDHPELDFSHSMTLSLWVWFDQHNPPYGYRLIDKQTPSIADGYTFDTQGDGTGSNMRFCPGSCQSSGVSNSYLPTQQWIHLGVVYNSGAARFFVNGNFVYEGSVSSIIPTNELPLTLGKTSINSASYPQYFLKGKLDDVRIYGRALNDFEFRQIYDAERLASDPNENLLAYYKLDGNVLDYSPNRNNGQVKGAILVDDRNNQEKRCYYLNGNGTRIEVSDKLSLNSVALGNDITLLSWIKLDDWVGSNGFYLSKASPNGVHFRFYGQQTQAALQLGNELAYTSFIEPLSANKWYHVAGVKRGNRFDLYLNGRLQGTAAFQTVADGIDTQAPFELGRDNHGPIESMKGYLDEVRLYSKALSLNEVDLIYKQEAITTKENAASALAVTYPTIGAKLLKSRKLHLLWEQHFDQNDVLIRRTLSTDKTQAAYRIFLKREGQSDYEKVKDIIFFDITTGTNAFVDEEGIIFPTVGTYEVKLFDMLTGVTTISPPFEVIDNAASDFNVRLQWDRSWNKSISTEPIGVAADSISRIVVSLKRIGASSKRIKNIKFSIEEDGYTVALTDKARLLGRISVAKTVDVYSREADLPASGSSYAKKL